MSNRPQFHHGRETRSTGTTRGQRVFVWRRWSNHSIDTNFYSAEGLNIRAPPSSLRFFLCRTSLKQCASGWAQGNQLGLFQSAHIWRQPAQAHSANEDPVKCCGTTASALSKCRTNSASDRIRNQRDRTNRVCPRRSSRTFPRS